MAPPQPPVANRASSHGGDVVRPTTIGKTLGFLRGHAEPQAAATPPAGDRLRCSPAGLKVERLLGAAVGTGAARVGRELRRAEALEELPEAVGEERRHQHKVRDRDEYAQHRDAPPFAEPGEGAPNALLAVERMDRHGATRRLAAIPLRMNGSTRVVCRRKRNHPPVLAAYVKSTVFAALPWTVTVAVCVPYFSCHASIFPTLIPKTRGWYMQPFWSMTTGVVGAGYSASAEIPVFTYTNTSDSVPLGFTTTICFGWCGVAWEVNVRKPATSSS